MSQLHQTRILKENRDSDKKIHLNRGGTRSSKTYSLVQLAVLWLTNNPATPTQEVWSIVRKTLPALKATAYRDFWEIVTTLELWPVISYNLSNGTFAYGNRMIEFFSLDDQQKVRSRKRTHLHIVEANEIGFETFTQLALRTKGKLFLDWNPDDPNSWLREELEIKRAEIKGDVKVIVSNYKDNPHLTKEEIAEIEYLKEVDPELWAVFGTGEYGTLTDVIFQNYRQEEYPKDCDYEKLGIDFGYSHDPAAVILVGKKGNTLYVKELAYETHLTNTMLYHKIKEWENIEGVADSAEPKSIADLNSYGMRIYKSPKGADSIRAGIMLLRQYDLVVDPASINLIKELRAYKWSDKKDGVPIDAYNHALDALRYVAMKFFRREGGIKIRGWTKNG